LKGNEHEKDKGCLYLYSDSSCTNQVWSYCLGDNHCSGVDKTFVSFEGNTYNYNLLAYCCGCGSINNCIYYIGSGGWTHCFQDCVDPNVGPKLVKAKGCKPDHAPCREDYECCVGACQLGTCNSPVSEGNFDGNNLDEGSFRGLSSDLAKHSSALKCFGPNFTCTYDEACCSKACLYLPVSGSYCPCQYRCK